jgi:hypothetical protein
VTQVYAAPVRWIVGWDSAAQVLWNTAALIVLVAALASWRRTPRAWFARAGTGRWWVLLLTVVGIAAIGGFWIPVGSVVWFAYWRPRLKRPAEPVALLPAEPSLGVPGEPLI